jgi:hypothetical protein
METPLIRYNLKERGRKYTGPKRDFNIKAICDAINGPACQEIVASRGMIGFYGHMPRVRYGLKPTEGGIEDGRYVPVEPAIVTTHLKADYDGNIEHKEEFLSTDSGNLAAKLWANKVGGFSSAIDTVRPAFFGFDYVANPNYIGNSYRGVVMDDAFSGRAVVTYDDALAAEREERDAAFLLLLDSLTAERDAANASIERLTEENEELMLLLTKRGIDPRAALDSAGTLDVDFHPMKRILDGARDFNALKHLPGTNEPPEREPEMPAVYNRMKSFMRRL